jgi:hypothetical protein
MVYQNQKRKEIIDFATYHECERISQQTQAIFGIEISDHVNRERHLFESLQNVIISDQDI